MLPRKLSVVLAAFGLVGLGCSHLDDLEVGRSHVLAGDDAGDDDAPARVTGDDAASLPMPEPGDAGSAPPRGDGPAPSPLLDSGQFPHSPAGLDAAVSPADGALSDARIAPTDGGLADASQRTCQTSFVDPKLAVSAVVLSRADDADDDLPDLQYKLQLLTHLPYAPDTYVSKEDGFSLDERDFVDDLHATQTLPEGTVYEATVTLREGKFTIRPDPHCADTVVLVEASTCEFQLSAPTLDRDDQGHYGLLIGSEDDLAPDKVGAQTSMTVSSNGSLCSYASVTFNHDDPPPTNTVAMKPGPNAVAVNLPLVGRTALWVNVVDKEGYAQSTRVGAFYQTCQKDEALCLDIEDQPVCVSDWKTNTFGCGTQCKPCTDTVPHGAPACVEGACAVKCDPGYAASLGLCQPAS